MADSKLGTTVNQHIARRYVIINSSVRKLVLMLHLLKVN